MTVRTDRSYPLVVGVDASFGTVHAVQWAAREAVRRGAMLRLVHAADTAAETGTSEAVGESPGCGPRAAGEVLVGVFAEMVRKAYPALAVDRVCAAGSAVETLVAHSDSACRVVLGSNGRADYSRAALGSLTQRVAARAACPTIVVPGGSLEHLGRSGERDGEPVVAAIGDDVSAEAVAEVAAEEASLNGARLLLVHVRPDADDDTRRLLLDLAQSCRVRFPSVQVATATPRGERAPALLSVAARAGLLVLGCHHANQPFDTRLGDLAAAVVPLAESPVALVAAAPVPGGQSGGH